MTALEEYLEHSGVKGMKWGVTRVKNRMDTHAIKKNADSAKKDLSYYKNVERLEKKANSVTGDGTSKIARAKGNALHSRAMKGRYAKAGEIDKRDVDNFKAVYRTANRNSKVAAKLQSKVDKASGKKKERLQSKLDVFNAYSKSHAKRMQSEMNRYNKNTNEAHKHHVNGINADNARTERIYDAKHPNNKRMSNAEMDAEMKKELKRQGVL